MLHNAKCHYNLFFLKKKNHDKSYEMEFKWMKWQLHKCHFEGVIFLYIKKNQEQKIYEYNQYSQKSMSLALEKQI